MTELISCTDELNRLKNSFRDVHLQSEARRRLKRLKRQEEFDRDAHLYTLEELMKPSKRFLEMGARILAERQQGWIDAFKGGPFPKV